MEPGQPALERPSPAPDDIAHVIAPPPLIYLVPLAGALLLNRWAPLPGLPAPWRWVVGALFLVLGGMLGTAISAFRRARTKPQPWLPTTALVVDGPYRFTRNPMYLGFTLIYSGIAVLANSTWPFVLLPAVLVVMQLFVIRREERYLERKFGDAYRAYCARVRRWL